MPSDAELPGNTAQWTVHPDRAVLLIHDMQRYFLRPFDGQEPVTELVRNVARLRERCAELGMPIAYTMQPGSMTKEQRGLLKEFWGPGMTVNPVDRAVVEPLSPHPQDWIFTKWRYSAFHRTSLLDCLRASGRDQLITCGVYAHVGVLMTTCDAFSHDIQPFLIGDAIADFSPRYHRLALEYAARRCALVANTEAFLARLGVAPAGS